MGSLLAFVVTIVRTPSMLLGMPPFNILMPIGVLVLWWMRPPVGAWAFTAIWIPLVIDRIFYGEALRAVAPLTVINQNGSSSWLMMVAIIGAIRSGFTHDPLGCVLGGVGAFVLLVTQGTLFRSWD